MVTVRGIEFQGNLDNTMGLEFYNLSHRFGFQHPNWPYFQDVQIERIHYMAKSGVLSQRITTTMHATTHIDAPALYQRSAPAAFLWHGDCGQLAEEKVGADYRRRFGKGLRPRHPPR